MNREILDLYEAKSRAYEYLQNVQMTNTVGKTAEERIALDIQSAQAQIAFETAAKNYRKALDRIVEANAAEID